LKINQEKIVVNSQGGTAPYWVGLSTNNLQANPSFEQLTAGSYTVYGKDANNCSFSLGGINLTQPSDITFSTLMKKDVDCDYYSKEKPKFWQQAQMVGLVTHSMGITVLEALSIQ
jgi:hypothetical protein